MSSMTSSSSLREKQKLAKFRGGTQSFRQWMLSIERQIGSEDPRLRMLIHRTIDLKVPIVQRVIEDYVTNMIDDTVYWQSQSDGTAKGEFAYRCTKLSTLDMKLYYRLLDALEDEALAYVETQQVARNGCEVLRLLKSRYALGTQYIETVKISQPSDSRYTSHNSCTSTTDVCGRRTARCGNAVWRVQSRLVCTSPRLILL